MAQDIPSLERQSHTTRENQFQFIVSTFSRHWFLIFAITVTVALSAWTISVFWESKAMVAARIPKYKAESILVIRHPDLDNPYIRDLASKKLILSSTPQSVHDKLDLDDLYGKIASAIVQEDITKGAAWAGTSEDEIRSRQREIRSLLRIVPEDSTNTIKLTVTSTSRLDALRIVELASRILIEKNRLATQQEGEAAYTYIKNELKETRSRLQEAKTVEWQHLRSMNFRTHQKVTSDMQSMQSNLSQAQEKKVLLQAEIEAVENALKAKKQQLPTAIGQMSDSVVANLMADLEGLIQEEIQMQVVYTDKWEPLQLKRADIQDKRAAVLEAMRLQTGGVNAWQEHRTLRMQHLALQVAVSANDITIATLNKRLGEMVDNLPEIERSSRLHEPLALETQQLDADHGKLVRKEFELRNALNSSAAQVERASDASVTALALPPSKASRLWRLMAGAIVGFLIGFAAAAVLEMLDTAIKSAEDITTFLNLNIIGTIPEMKFGKSKRGRRGKATYVALSDEDQLDSCIVTQHDPKSPISESYRALRTSFQFATIKDKPKSIMVTSAVPGEGKTTTAVNMAVTMADYGLRVLLIDFDLRRPNVHRVLKLERGPGLADVLREGLDLHSVIRPTRVENLWAISSGRVPPNPSELIGSKRMRDLMHQLTNEFDLVICDAPSIMVVTDPVLLAANADTVVLVVAVNRARRETIIRAKKHLDAASANIAGVVLNGLEASRRHYYYYYYYYDEGMRHGKRKWYHL